VSNKRKSYVNVEVLDSHQWDAHALTLFSKTTNIYIQGMFMNKSLLLASTLILATSIFSSAQAQDDLIYVAVKPCRIGDTRKSPEGVVNANTSRNFKVYGTDAELAVQGGQLTCPSPKPGVKPQAVAAYIVAVPSDSSTGPGVLTAYPSNEPSPPPGTGSTVNFSQGQAIGNTTIATLCNANQCPSDGELAVLARDTNEDVVIDVQGYFYPAGAIGNCITADLQGNWQTFIAAPNLGWSSCAAGINSSGNVGTGTCNSSGGALSVNGGQLQIDSSCAVGGAIFVNNVQNKIERARLSADHNSITGIVTIQGDSTTFNAVRF
jgi:hypothetical protein